jgi:hypothetical protein
MFFESLDRHRHELAALLGAGDERDRRCRASPAVVGDDCADGSRSPIPIVTSQSCSIERGR